MRRGDYQFRKEGVITCLTTVQGVLVLLATFQFKDLREIVYELEFSMFLGTMKSNCLSDLKVADQ